MSDNTKDGSTLPDDSTSSSDAAAPAATSSAARTVTGVASSTSSLSEAEALLADMMKRQATVTSPSGGAEILASGKKLGAAKRQQMGGKVGQQEEEKKKHAFWDTQPMLHERQGDSSATPAAASASASSDAASSSEPTTAAGTTTTTTATHCPIVPNRPKSELRQEPYNMPKGFHWSVVDVLDPTQLDEVYDLLAKNYVEDDDCMFRFDYSPEFLIWALTPPGFDPSFHLGVRSAKSNRLMAFITGVPAKVRAYETAVPMVEINFLCVHKKLRSKRLAPVLIKEITRRVNHTGVFQAVYTAGVVLPVPVASCRYYHRSLDPKKLVDIGFSRIPQRMTMARMQKLYRLPSEPVTANLREMTPEDVPGAHKLLVAHLKKFKLAVEFAEDEFAHWLLPREGVINTYVASDDEAGEITDLCSFYHLPSSIIGHPRHSTLKAAYSFYNVATSVTLTELMKDCLILAKHGEGQDVFNALNLMENEEFLSELKFGVGDGQLQYYLYNWACPEMEPKDVGIVLL